MEDKRPRLFFRIDEDQKKQFQKYCIDKGTTVQKTLESYVQLLMELNIHPDTALAAIREAHKKPGT